MQRFKQYFPELLLCLTIFLPSFFQGGRASLGVLLMSIAAAAYAFIAYRAGWLKKNKAVFSRFFYGVLCVFIIWIILNSLFYANDVHTALKTALPLIVGSMLFMVIAGTEQTRKEQVYLMLLAGSSLFVFIGIVFFVQSQNFGYLRLISTFYHHNGFAGFLLPFLPLSLWMAHERQKNLGRLLPYVVPILLFTGFLLTFSRGGYISAVVSLAVYFFLLWRAESGRPFVLWCGISLVILTISGIFAYGLFSLKEVQSARADVSDISPYPIGTNSESSFKARVEYMKIAGTLFAGRPFAGYGLGSFGTFARTVQTDVRFFSADPHNLYLRFFVELGYFGGILFLAFVGGLVIHGSNYISRHRSDMVYAALFSGLLGMFIHNGGDFDFQFPATVILFFCVSGMLVSKASSKITLSEKEHNIQRVPELSFSSRLPALLTIPTIVVVCIIFAAGATFFFISSQKSARAQAALFAGDIAGAGKQYEKAVRFDHWDAQLSVDAARAYLAAGNTEKAFNELARAVRLAPYDRTPYLLLADFVGKQNNTTEAIRLYEGALALAPYKDLQAVFGLMDIYFKAGNTNDAIIVGKDALVRFPEESFDSSLWIDPNKEELRTQRRILEDGIKSLESSD